MSENQEPDWLAELAKGGEALRRQMESIVRAAEQFAAGGPTRPLAQRIAASMRELLPASERHVIGHSAISGTAVASITAVAGLPTASGTAFMPEVRCQAEMSIGQILSLALVAIATWKLLVLLEHDRAAVDHYLTVIGFGLTVAMLIWNMHK